MGPRGGGRAVQKNDLRGNERSEKGVNATGDKAKSEYKR